jgi:penicillin-binding protein 2
MLTPGAYEDRQSLQTRLVVLRVGAFLAFGFLAVSFWLLQVVQHEQYKEMAENNRLRTIPLQAPRGNVFDREGVVLVRNRPSFTISLIREQSADVDVTLDLLASYTSAERAGLDAMVERHGSQPGFRPIPLIEHATESQVATVMAHKLELPELEVQVVPTRLYPDSGGAAHALGYVSEIREAQLAHPEFEGLGPGAMVGQTGLERAYNGLLMGVNGSRRVVVNSVGREIEEYGYERPIEGTGLRLTIDADVQRALEEAFAFYGVDGAAAFLDPNTGEILAMTSLPAFDSNDFATGMDSETMAALNSDPRKPFTNKLIQGTYMPGSTFKIVMATAALGENVIDSSHTEVCNGSVFMLGRTWRCNGRHGRVDLGTAIERSCNVFFYKLGQMLSIDTIHDYAVKLGLVGRSGLDLPGEEASNVPSTAQSEAQGLPWYPGQTISVAIGQGRVDVTPMALARMVSTIANGGKRVVPYLLDATRAPDEESSWEVVTRPTPEETLSLPPADLEKIRHGLWRVVNGELGTARRSVLPGSDMAGKTGSAQVVSNAGKAAARAAGMDVRDHGFFVTFAPPENAKIAGVVFGEHAEHGSEVAPIARHVVATYLAKLEGRPAPSLTDPGVPRPRLAAGGGRP